MRGVAWIMHKGSHSHPLRMDRFLGCQIQWANLGTSFHSLPGATLLPL